jgi:hypothetical protein
MEAPTVGIGRLLKEGSRFSVPHHQRDYSWTEDEIDQLFIDIADARDKNQHDYFIGLLVFIPKEEREFTILDGQQRLVTTVMFLSAVRTWLKAHGLDADAYQIQNSYIAARELGKRDLEPKLVLNENNNDYFINYVVNEAPIEDIEKELASVKRYDPNRRLLEAAIFCRQKVDEIASSGQNANAGAEALYGWVRYFEDSVKVVRLNVSNEANAYTVFETLNYRGLDLNVVDLVKNYLFGRATSTTLLRDIQARWAQMLANLANVRADDFLKTWWTSRNGRVQVPQLFSQFKVQISSSAQVGSVSKDMLTASEQYAALEIADDPLWSSYSAIARERVRSLKLLGGLQVHPILLSALAKFNQHEIERLLRLLEVLIVRYQLVGGGRTGRLEISCARLANEIFKGRCKSAAQAFTLLKDIFPPDKEFKEAFKTKQERNNQKARYILSNLERQERVKANLSAELEPSISLTLEHILPKSPDSSWNPILKKDAAFHEDCTYRIGNLCLLTGVNRALGARGFDDKKASYKISEILLTRSVSKCDLWNRQSVEKRQAYLAELAVTFWRFQ